jgi:hypothetical protein
MEAFRLGIRLSATRPVRVGGLDVNRGRPVLGLQCGFVRMVDLLAIRQYALGNVGYQERPLHQQHHPVWPGGL